ncbi:MAG: purine phosphoribosyltransferase family protein, partial [Planctomycetota bacterium]
RKPGKLPRETITQSYALEYGEDTLQVHSDAIRRGEKVLMVDDLLATGGTMGAACDLVNKMGGQIVGSAFVIELAFLNGRQKLIERGIPVHSLLRVDD